MVIVEGIHLHGKESILCCAKVICTAEREKKAKIIQTEL
jgi:hypothetical protein